MNVKGKLFGVLGREDHHKREEEKESVMGSELDQSILYVCVKIT
jgi:hypothetical protein